MKPGDVALVRFPFTDLAAATTRDLEAAQEAFDRVFATWLRMNGAWMPTATP